MSKIFCQGCGGATSYLEVRPSKCSRCNRLFNTTLPTESVTKIKVAEEGEEEIFLEDINPFDHVEIQMVDLPLGFTLGEIMSPNQIK